MEPKPNQDENVKIEVDQADQPVSSPVSASKSSTKPQKSKLSLVCAIICGVIAVAAIGLAVYTYLDANKKAGEIAKLKAKLALIEFETGADLVEIEQDGQTVTVVDTSASDEEKVMKVVDTLRETIETTNKISFIKVYDYDTILVKLDRLDTRIPINHSYGIYAPYGTITMDQSNAAIKTASNELTKLGFVKNSADETPFNSASYTNQEDGIICVLSDGLPTSISCGKNTWVSKVNIDLAEKLATAIKDVEGEYPFSIFPNPDAIEDSKISPYQTLVNAVTNAAGLFYRVSPDSEWKFFTATQAMIDCSDFNTQDLKNAFAGHICWNDAKGEESTVNP